MTFVEGIVQMFTSVPPDHMFLIVFIALGLAVIFIPPGKKDDEDT